MKPTQQHGIDRLMEKLENHPQSIQWQDLVSDPRIAHSFGEREQLLQTGTAGHQAVLTDLYYGWQQPWFFWTVLKVGAILIAACFVLVYGCQLLLNTTTQVAVEMLFLIPPMVVPVALMVFFWELNVPRNLTIWELLSFFLVGTLLSLGANALMFTLVGNKGGPIAALREEPAKLFAGVILLLYCSKVKGKKVYGLTGLVIGAAVGSGFSAFETISYGLHYSLETVMIRVIFAVVGHTLYSCSYLTALSLHAPNGRVSIQSFLNSDFVLTFLVSVCAHAFWNMAEVPLGIRFAITLILLWYSALWIIRKALLEAWTAGKEKVNRGKGNGISYIELRCLRGEVVGKKWTYSNNQQVSIGRGEANQICLPDGIGGISRSHCYLEMRPDGWAITDTHSTYGTYLQLPGGSISRLIPGKPYLVTSGTLLFLGSQKVCLGISIF